MEADAALVLNKLNKFMPGRICSFGVHKYFPMIGFSMAMVFFGQTLRSVMMALVSALWQGQVGSAGIWGMALATMALAVAAFFMRLAMTISTVTWASSTFQQS